MGTLYKFEMRILRQTESPVREMKALSRSVPVKMYGGQIVICKDGELTREDGETVERIASRMIPASQALIGSGNGYGFCLSRPATIKMSK